MSNIEHYFENLLFNGCDVKGDWNKNSLTEKEQEAVKTCADYVLYTVFLNREDFLKFVRGEQIPKTDTPTARQHDEGIPDFNPRGTGKVY